MAALLPGLSGGGVTLLDDLLGADGRWATLRQDDRLKRELATAQAAIPTDEAIAASAPDFRSAWQPLREQLLIANGCARAAIASER